MSDEDYIFNSKSRFISFISLKYYKKLAQSIIFKVECLYVERFV